MIVWAEFLRYVRGPVILCLAACLLPWNCFGDDLLKVHCADCHTGEEAEAGFQLTSLGDRPTPEKLKLWLDAFDRVQLGEMPPPDDVELSDDQRSQLVASLRSQLDVFAAKAVPSRTILPRRLNNREFRNSIRDVLLIEDVGTHQPTADLIGDSLHEGFDTHAETLGFSNFHLEQYIEAVRKIVDATILTEQPSPQRIRVASTDIVAGHTSQNTNRRERVGTADGFDFLDPGSLAYFRNFKTVRDTGRYRITIRATGLDRGYYAQEKTGIYDHDPIQLVVRLGDRRRVFDLPDGDIRSIELDEWIASGTRLRMQYPTDGLRLRNNGNFKFQNAIAGEHIRETEPQRYAKLVAAIRRGTSRRARTPQSWHHWVEYWRGPRPRVFSATIEGPFYDSWPPKRQVALLGENPTAANAAAILIPIAERAWRRKVRPEELDRIVKLVHTAAAEHGEITALKEGVVAVLVSPKFLLVNTRDAASHDRLASKVSLFLGSTIPNERLRRDVASGSMGSFDGVLAEVRNQFKKGQAEPFLRAFPFGWLRLNDINFMAPDPDQYRFYHRKQVSDDMINEALHFFRHAVAKDVPITDFISADYSFLNADLARVYGVEGVRQDSQFRKHVFTDGRRGGLLGMGAFLTVTADSLATSPIHRATYVMKNFLGIHPTPPPADVQIEEPDVRAAVTIKEILNRHASDANCAACHRRIDPFGYAFENFDPTGAWRDDYTFTPPGETAARRRRRSAESIPIDASAQFLNGSRYDGIVKYRELLASKENRRRFVRCFVVKLLTYANGAAPRTYDFAEVDRIVATSKEYDYRIVETIAAVIDSPLFREQ